MADSPKEAEAAQALFCAVVDYEGKQISPKPRNFLAFKDKYRLTIQKVRRKVVTPGVTIDGIERFLTRDQEWYDSSVNIANKLLTETRKIARNTYNKIKPSGIDLFYVRDDRNTFKSISKLFTYVNKRVKARNAEEQLNDLSFNNLNKWSPADIYLSSKKAQRLLLELSSGPDRTPRQLATPLMIGRTRIYSRSCLVSFSVFNSVIKSLMDSGDLLPLSLKKSPDKKRTIIKTINYVENDVSNALKDQNIGYHGFLFSKTTNIFKSKDIYIKFTTKPKIMMQFRDKGSTSGGSNIKFSYQGLITGGTEALDGGLGGGSIGDVLGQTSAAAGRFFTESNQARIQQDANDISRDMNESIELAIDNPICDRLYSWISRYKGNKYQNSFASKLDLFQTLYDDPNFQVGARGITNQIYADRARAQFIYSKYMGGRMIEFLEGLSKKKADEMVINLVLYAGSRTSKSSPHFKASDISSF